MTPRRLLSRLTFAAALLLPFAAHAWWNDQWPQRARVVLDTSAAGVPTQDAAGNLPLALRLHSGNFDFLAAKPDGSDLRLVAADDKTPLKFHVERWDAANELALVWVWLPSVAPGSDKNVVHAYYGNSGAASEAATPAAFYDSGFAAVLHFAQAAGTPVEDASGQVRSAAPLASETNGLLGPSARFDGSAPLLLPANGRLRFAANGPLTVSMWVRPTAAAGTLWQQGAVSLAIADGKLAAQVGNARLAGGDPAAGAWSHVALAVGGGKALLFVNGAQVAQADAQLPETAGDTRIGAGYSGLVDELQIAASLRSADWLKLAAASQGTEGKLVAVTRQSQDEAEAGEDGGHNYFSILIKNLTVDAWVVIVILMVMLVIACWVMVAKALLVGRIDQGNRAFLQRFRAAGDDLLALPGAGGAQVHSSLFRLYQAGVREMGKRLSGTRGGLPTADLTGQRLSGASIDAIKASIDADLVRESHKLNAQMVLLTIAISGGPFLGLLGTVVGVMITFAAIAAAGDVNVNAIAPGIAAALLATVAGLGVAIPALFGYNYLASRIKNISADMQIFVDEFVTRVAEVYGAR